MASLLRMFSRCKKPADRDSAEAAPETTVTTEALPVQTNRVEVKQLARLQPPDLVLPEKSTSPCISPAIRSQTVDGHTTWIASVVTSRSTPSSASSTSRLMVGTPLSPMTIGSEMSSRPNSHSSRARRKRDTPKRLVGRPKQQSQDSRACSTRLSDATEDSLPCSTRRSEEDELDSQAFAEELTEEVNNLADVPEALPEVGLEETFDEQHLMEAETVKESLATQQTMDAETVQEHVVPTQPDVLQEAKEALETQQTMDAETVQEHVVPTQPDVLQEAKEVLDAEHTMKAETVQKHASPTQPEALWVPHISAESEGLVYYHNVSTDEVSWNKPAPEALQVTEWVLHTSPEGKPYYFNDKTTETSWELVPGGVVVPSQASVAAEAEETSKKAAEFAKAEELKTASESAKSPGTESKLFRPPLLEAPPPMVPRRGEPPPRIDQGNLVRTKRMDAGFEKWAMSLCMEMAPRGSEAGGPPPARKASSAAPMMPPPA
eukprot:TRINITY_DN5028_c0_g1_i1.p1 TRINITY_DN5028_c0_g1~~TRINITY_DN5028_c0_g1_i1.p1  ORF type:complete len:491 (-),score=112.40 TRINITY_DN5028_c0_g1_i1:67-1539(-)